MKPREDTHTRIVFGIYLAGFGVGAFNHARDFIAYGSRPYNWGPNLLETFWTSLIVLDLLAIALLLSRHRQAGLLLASIIMIADVAANTYALVILRIPAFGLYQA